MINDNDISTLVEDKLAVSTAMFGIEIPQGYKQEVIEKVQGDLKTYADKDPSKNSDIHQVLEASVSFKAVLLYRVAHLFWTIGKEF